MLAPEGRVIMVSGANRGIGRAIAERLHDAGYTLSLGVRDPDSLTGMTRGWDPDRLLRHRYDAEDKNTHRAWVDGTASRFGRIDGLVNNAGMVVRVTVEADRGRGSRPHVGSQREGAAVDDPPRPAASQEERRGTHRQCRLDRRKGRLQQQCRLCDDQVCRRRPFPCDPPLRLG